jgi:hypothetical protein
MKSFLYLFIVLSLSTACSNSSDNFIVSEEVVPITMVTAPETLTVGTVATFSIEFKIPTTCHDFLRLNFGSTPDARTVSVVTSVREGNCNTLSNASQSISFEVTPDQPGMFTFRFFTGNDSQGNPTFIVKEYDVAPRPVG